MTAKILEIADAVVEALNTGVFSLGFTAERAYLPVLDLPGAGVLHVTVVPREDRAKLDTRSSSSHEYAIDIGVQEKLTHVDKEHLDPLVELTQEIADFFLFGRRFGNATLVAPEIRVLYVQDHLHQLRQFTSVITLTFRAWREASG